MADAGSFRQLHREEAVSGRSDRFRHIEIRYVPKSTDLPIDLAALTQRVRSALKQPLDVTVRAVDAIPRSRNGKYEDFVSHVPN